MAYRILVIDDTQVIRDFLAEVLTDYGFDVDIAANGKEAIALIVENDYAMVFCDIHMPGMNGLQTVQGIFEIKPDLPIIMTDSYPGRLAEEAQKTGAISCLSKPFSLEELKAIISKILNTKDIIV